MLNSIPEPIQNKASTWLRANADENIRLQSFSFSSGGCINKGGRLHTSVGDYFIKWNSATAHPDMFRFEAKALQLLGQTKSIRVPELLHFDEALPYQFLMLEFIHEGRTSKTFWEDFGRQLAKLHQHTSDAYGLDHDNYIGSLPQSNKTHHTWHAFFMHERIDPLLDRLMKKGACNSKERKSFDELIQKLPDLLPEEKPALLHGDLWTGNVMRDEHGNPVLIDPAIYYGHREMDLAFTTMFGRFPDAFYESYNEVFPLKPGFERRKGLYNLYPLLVHAVLFGAGYFDQAFQIVKKFKA